MRRRQAGCGQAMAPHVQEAIERSLKVDLGGTGSLGRRRRRRKRIAGARAFTSGATFFSATERESVRLWADRSRSRPRGSAAIRAGDHRSSSVRADALEREADRRRQRWTRRTFTVSERVAGPAVQRLGLSDALDYFADKAYMIPGFRMFTIVLGVNPVNMRHVDRSPANIMRAVVEFIPGGN